MTKEEIVKTNAINNKDIQSNKKFIIIDLQVNVIIFESDNKPNHL